MTDLLFDTEIWVPIPGFTGSYEVSSHGRIKALRKIRETGRTGSTVRIYPELIMKPNKAGKSKYLLIQLRRDGQDYWFSVHRLVARAFVPNPLNLPEVNHNDTNKLNNRADNLSWTDHKGNAQHAQKNGLFKNNFGRHNNPSSKKVIDFDGTVFESVSQAADAYGLSVRSLYHQLSGTQKKKTQLKFL